MKALFVVRNIENAEPHGLMILAAVLRRAGHEVRLVGARTTRLPPVMEDFAPDVVGYSACTGLHRYLLRLNRWLKRHWSFVSVFGGPHPTFFPEMIDEDGVDIVCRGEGEGAIVDLATAVDEGRPLDSIANLWVKTPDGVRRNPMRPLIADLDALPFPDRELRYESDPPGRDYPVKSFLVSRGCPFRCTYCFNSGYAELYGPAWCRPRTRSVGNVVAEIQAVRAASRLEFVQFRESVFPWQEAWLEEFAGRYPGEVGLPFYCHVRADLLTARRVELLSRAGCVSVNMGIECGDETYRRERLGRAMTNAQIVEACRLLHAHGIRILADNMVGLPGAGAEADWKTLRLNQQCEIDYPLAMIFQPYPGTELARQAEAMGLFDGDYDAIDYNYYLRSPLAFASEAERRETENLQKLFAVLVEAPWLERLVRRMLRWKPNLTFLSIFRTWYIYCYRRRIVPHRLTRPELRELARSIFGLYPPEANHEAMAEEAGQRLGVGGRRGGEPDRESVHHGLWRQGQDTAQAQAP